MGNGPDAAAPAPEHRADDVQMLLRSLAASLHTPLALLSRDDQTWRFEAEAFPPDREPPAGGPLATMRSAADDARPSPESEVPLTGFILGRARGREWVLLVPGSAEDWRAIDEREMAIHEARRSLRRILAAQGEPDAERFGRRIYAFSRRLARETDSSRIHALILRTIARHVRARIGALALYQDEDQALAITATHGYPSVLVEHLRIAPGEGILGRAYASGKADLGHAESRRRLRYRTNSYLQIPLPGPLRPAGVIALTDREDGQPFDPRDLAEARILAAPASLALAREDVQQSFNELQRMAAIDSVTGLFNRRHFEARLHGEVQRVHRQQQPLSLLMVDIDDFKRINDTFGHIEGDRTLRTVAELLRGGVRIFDVCARYGGEEFAILMPGAPLETAAQVAERIRRRVHHRFRHDPVGVTISIGVATLAPGESGEELVGDADRRLGLAKRAGKNAVEAHR
jgi:diguanylate cyclase (GGDEF)-like protein